MRLHQPFFFSVLSLALTMACSGSVGGGGGGGGGGGDGGSGGSGNAGTGGSTSASGSGGSTSSGIDCNAAPPVFPSFDKTCTGGADCIIKFHMISCCGTRAAIGMNVSESAAFDQAEAVCEAMYPGCGCAQGPTEVEDGNTTLDESTIQVDCISGACSTFIP